MEEDLLDRRYVLSGFDDRCPSDTISMYIHSCSHGAEHSWEAAGGDSIVVTFEEDIDGHQFMQKTLTKRFNEKRIEACRLELTKSVIVHVDISQFSEGYLAVYFALEMMSGGDMFKSLVRAYRNNSIVITYEDWKVAQRVAERKHTLKEKELVAQLFYPDFQWVLKGKTPHRSKFSTDIAILVPPELLSFISHTEIFREELTSALQRVHAMVSFNIISKHPQLELKISMSKNLLGHLRHGPAWETNARIEVRTILERYIVEHIPMKAEVWQRVKGGCPEVNAATALISFKICTSELVVVRRRVEGETLALLKIMSKMEKAKDERQVVNSTIDLEVFLEKVQTAELLIYQIQEILTFKKLDSSYHLARFLEPLDLHNFQYYNFYQDNIVAVLICGKDSVTVLAKKGDIDRAEYKLKEVIKQASLYISGEYNKETFGGQWKTFHAELKKENFRNVLIELSGDKMDLCGFRSEVDNVIAQVKGFLENKKVVTEDVPLKTCQEVEFVESFMKLSADPQLKALGVTILSCRYPQSPCFKVTAASDHIKEAINVVNRYIRTVETRNCMYSKAGEAKILKNNKLLLKMLAKGLGCNLELSEQNISYDLKGGVTLTLSQGNVAKQTSDVITVKISAPQGCLASACRDVSFPKVEVEVLGCCSSALANVKKLVDDLVTKEWKLLQISSPYLALLLPSEKQAIVALSRSLQVCVSVSAPDKATVSGKEADALAMVLQIEKHLQKAKERATRQEEEKRLWKTVRWEVCDREAWAELDPSVSIDLEHALHKKEQRISYTLQNQTYTVNLDKMERTDRNGTIARIKRTLKAGSEIGTVPYNTLL
ncbi:uncharacterized protein LOC132448323 [Gadus macrocephalus]|uniref:uncharacterized protein LOC132448323 n=1 Tax=Gadus macrocephalus TaxID=80720 RepID=UPI0028CBBF04|nr:uncharacterized protein LOC132448323 [Gadus macrocephalus]